jgi:hypothetical protein
LVSGTLVSGHKYFEHFGEEAAAAKADDKENAESHRAVFANSANSTMVKAPEKNTIHLKNAKVPQPWPESCTDEPVKSGGGAHFGSIRILFRCAWECRVRKATAQGLYCGEYRRYTSLF